MLFAQVEPGHACPVSMTHAAVPIARARGIRPARRMDAAAAEPRVRAGARRRARRDEAVGARRHGDDREAGRLRRAREHDARRADAASTARGAREFRLTGHKWFCSAPMSDAFLVLAQAPRRAQLLLRAARAARRVAERVPHPATEGQARQPLERVERDRARRHAWRGSSASEGRGVATIVQMVHAHPARLRDRHRRRDAAVGRRGGVARAAPQRVRRAARRPARDGGGRRRPRARVRGGDAHGHAARALPTTATPDDAEQAFRRLATAGLEVLGVQARTAARVRGARVPRRQRLHRGVPARPALPGAAGARDLGGLGQRHRPRRAARARARARGVRRVLRRSSARRRGSTPAFDLELAEAQSVVREVSRGCRGRGLARTGAHRAARPRAAGVAARAASPAVVADAFVRTRIEGEGGRLYGALPPGVDTAAILERA